MKTATHLEAEIAAVCPVVPGTTSIGSYANKATWAWTPAGNATQQQIDAGNSVVANWDYSAAAQAILEAPLMQAAAKALLADLGAQGKAFRGMVAGFCDVINTLGGQVNTLGGQITTIKSAITAPNATLVTIKTAVGNMQPLTPLTALDLPSVLTGIGNRIGDGTAN